MKLFTELRKVLRLDPWVLARKLAEAIVPLPDKILGSLRSRDLSKVTALGQMSDIEYHDVGEVAQLLAERQIAALFKKNDALVDDNLCKLNAEKAFSRGERICRITNKRLDYYFRHEDRNGHVLRAQVRRMQTDIEGLLGDPTTYLTEVFRKIRMTNGATEDRSRTRSLPFLKITGKIRAPARAFSYLEALLSEMGVELTTCKFENVDTNTLVLVPKNWKTHRTIAKEPTHALPLQLTVDAFFKRRLLRWGVDLTNQGKNQDFARQGSIDGSIATIDLEMASDTLAYNAVALLLPTEWLRILNAFRSASYEAPWGFGRYAKFSSMGNGYTFSLESLIFTAACRAVGSRDHAVYGDDISIKTEYVASLVKLLSFLGFKVNTEKSFVNPASRFRESCGCDWYNGRLVTPFYLRELPQKGDTSSLCHIVNGLAGPSVGTSFWDVLTELVVTANLPLVPWNDDARSGVFISPRRAWDLGRLRVDTRPNFKDGKVNPDFGFPVYRGLGQRQTARAVHGWRSLLLWHIQAQCPAPASMHAASRTSALLLQRDATCSHLPNVTVTSQVIVSAIYGRKTRRYHVPVHSVSPDYLFLWDDLWMPPVR